jgi:hypothetical protein
MLDGGTLLHDGPIGGDAEEGTVRVEFAGDVTAIAGALEATGAIVSVDGQRVAVRHDQQDVFNLVRDVTAANGATIRRLDGGSASLEDLFLVHGDTP